ncbi:DUF397 domain-containing protein [Streptomyces mirabilis]|uniref:DUF397 domain-containing protein n=1 Tax=Streptomyces mirabilis TaxID=68239 RepID=UPI00332F0222
MAFASGSPSFRPHVHRTLGTLSAQGEALIWKTSTYIDSGSCVEWARPPAGVLVRGTKCRERARVQLSHDSWRAFVSWTKQA